MRRALPSPALVEMTEAEVVKVMEMNESERIRLRKVCFNADILRIIKPHLVKQRHENASFLSLLPREIIEDRLIPRLAFYPIPVKPDQHGGVVDGNGSVVNAPLPILTGRRGIGGDIQEELYYAGWPSNKKRGFPEEGQTNVIVETRNVIFHGCTELVVKEEKSLYEVDARNVLLVMWLHARLYL